MSKESIDLLVRANASQFNKEIKKSNKSLDKFRDKSKAGGKSAGGMGSKFKMIAGKAKLAAVALVAVAAAAVAAAVAFVRLGLAQFESIDALGKEADRLGVTTESLAALRHGADQAGSSAGAMDKTLERLSKRAYLATEGTGAAKRALGDLGIEAKKLAGLAPDKQFELIAEAIKKVENPSRRMALTSEILGDESRSLINLMMEGKEGIKAYGEEADRLGIALDRNSIKKVEEANDALDEMKKAWAGFKNQIAILIAPMVKMIGEKLTDALIWLRETFLVVVEKIIVAWHTLTWTWENAGALWAIEVDKMALSLVRFWEDLKHIFVVMIPGVFQAFGAATGTFFYNLGASIAKSIKEIWEFIASGGQTKINPWASLGDSFSEALEEVRALAHRAESETETLLREGIESQSKKLADSLAKHLLSKKKSEEAGEENGKAYAGGFNEKAKATKALTPNAVEAGTQAAFDVIFKARAATQSPEMQMVGEQKKTNEELAVIKTLIDNNGFAVAATA